MEPRTLRSKHWILASWLLITESCEKHEKSLQIAREPFEEETAEIRWSVAFHRS
jgi:hypothetical protein